MKRTLNISAFAVAFLFALVSCSDKTTYGTSTTVTLPSASVVVPYTGGTVSVKYGIGNSKDGGYMMASSEEDWLSDFDFSVEDTLSFFVAEHYEKVSRYGEIKLMYMLEADTLATNTLSVSQEYNSLYVFDSVEAAGQYYGMTNNYNADGVRQYSLYISDVQIGEYGAFVEGATYYFLDLWTNADVEGISYVSLPVGEYNFGQIGENWIISGASRYFVMNEGEDAEWEEYAEQIALVDGSLTVTRSGDITTISGSLEDYFGGIHEISYSGALSLENEGIISTLEGDEDVGELSDADCEARYYGDYYQTGTANWVLCIEPEAGTGFIIDICADASYTLDGGVPEGTFSVSTTGGVAGTFFNGVVFNGYVNGTWLLSLDEDGALTPPYAPIIDGTVEISASGDSYAVTIDGSDDRANKVTGSWTGVPTTSDYRTAVTSLSANRLGILKLR